MKIIICKDYDEVSKKAASIVIKEINKNPELKIGLATGSSPIGLYNNLIEAYQKNKISFKDVVSYNLDEYIGIDRSHPQSYYSFMHEHLFKHIDIQDEHIHIPNNDITRLDHLAEDYNKILRENQLDVQILGIGTNGHIGFNEPGTPLGNETFIVTLDEQTRMDNSRFFNNNIDEVPKFAITMGIKNIMYAKKILLIASGKEKAKVIHKMIKGKVSKSLPASILQLHPDCTVIIDENAASKLK
ncbi:MAG: glucosamine-6-phosphate deaminase [Tenericutes bacterium HGW-Tenericutes-2]|jgi:glucosamine-6-phosphate deaminase|nr:MAG: glucosamine-6-phosphate deaminase [Tenericutes bacterium HGW-Tenericutes-2]